MSTSWARAGSVVMEGYPDALINRPVPLVALVGEEGCHEVLVSNINKYGQSGSLAFVSLPRDHTFPKKKYGKAREFEGYNVNIILKVKYFFFDM